MLWGHHCGGAGAEVPGCLRRLRNAASSSVWPFASVSVMKRPPFSPLRSGQITIEILSPGLRLLECQPCRDKLFGLLHSMLHLSMPPFSLGTLTSIQLCGLVH